MKTKNRQEFDSNVGIEISNFKNIDDAIRFASIDYTVEKQPIFLEDGREIKGNYANVRSDNNQPISVIGERYTNLQNINAFSFMQELMDLYNVKMQKGGSYDGGRKSFITAQTEEPFELLGDKYSNKMTFLNSFDGSGSVKVIYVPMRMVCTNGLMLEDSQYRSQISIQHSKTVHEKLEATKNIMISNNKYISFIKEVCTKLASIRLTKKAFIEMIEHIMPIEDKATSIITDRVVERRENIMQAYNMSDLQNFNNSAYKAVMAISDYESHYEPIRNTGNDYIYLQRVVGGMKILNEVYSYMRSRLGISY